MYEYRGIMRRYTMVRRHWLSLDHEKRRRLDRRIHETMRVVAEGAKVIEN